jgi:hypothetical protein
MSDQQSQDEPSMEEILASIRRIISEDDPEQGKEASEEAAEPEAEAKLEENEEAPAVEEDEEEELELTEKVNADGSPEVPAETPETEAVEPEPEPEPEAVEPEPEAVEPEPEVEDLMAEAQAEEEAPAEEPEPAEVEAVEEQPEDLDVSLEPDDSELDINDLDEGETDNGESLISEPTQAAASTSLSEIARAALTQRALAIGDGRTLEDLVREALRPELKIWLDTHLASMVDRIVREEIKKMVRRVENQ